MVKIFKFTEYLYLVVALFSVYRIYTDWNVDRNFAYLFIFFAIISIGMFFFRRSYRKKFEKHKQNQNH
nr:hypothetical protein [Cellulophaga sp. L1A9]